MSCGRAAKGEGSILWLLAAAALHAAVAALMATSQWPLAPRPAAEQAAAARPLPLASIFELTLLDDAERATVAKAPPAPLARLEAVGTRAADREQTARSLEASSAGSASTPPGPEARAPTPSTAASDPRPSGAPRLSLDQLGIGSNPFMSIAVEPLSKEEQANHRLHAALHPFEGAREHQAGRGPERPVVDAARRLVLADDILVDTSAILNVRVDGGGRVTEVHLLEASGQIKDWQRIAARLAHALSPATLRVAESTPGWNLKLRLASSVQLPSGAAPGFRMGVLEQQVAGSGGTNSTRLELSPTAKLDLPEAIDSVGRHLDEPLLMDVMLLKLSADLTDIGAPARRVVEVAVLSIEAPPEL